MIDDAGHDANDASLVSWLPVAPDADFPVQALPFGIVSVRPPRLARPARRAAIAIGDHVVDVGALQHNGLFAGCELPDRVFLRPVLNDFLALGPTAWSAVRRRISWLLTRADGDVRTTVARCAVPADAVDVHLPIEVADYTDFYSSRHHAENLGRILRPGTPPLLPNWVHLPVGYHGRAGTVVLSGTPVARPCGLVQRDDGAPPVLAPSARLDVEVELGFVVGAPSEPQRPVSPDDALDHVFGVCIVNDWSARDIQAFEYQPLGPFLAKSFATSISPWIVPLEALAPAFVAPPEPEVERAEYLRGSRDLALPIRLTLSVDGHDLATVDARHLSYTFGQQLAHLTVNGAAVRTGDLFASGTISGPADGECGSLIELTRNAAEPLELGDGRARRFLEDGDTVVIRGECVRPDGVRIGLGRVEGTIVPVRADVEVT